MKLSYEFSVGSVRAREKSLFTYAELEQMLNLKSENELVRFLKDKGYGEGETVSEIVESNAEQMWKYIESIAPDFSVFEPFLLKNDIHNIKTILKGIMYQKEFRELLIFPCRIKPDEIKSAIENKKFGNLPEFFSEPVAKAYDLLAKTADSRLSDAVIDRAALEIMISEGKNSKSEFLAGYFNTFAFYANVKTALRDARFKPVPEYLDNALCECEGFDKPKVISKTLAGREALVRYLEKVRFYDCDKAMESFSRGTGEFEKFVDNKLMRLAKEMCRLTSEGPEPLFGYYIGCEYERQAIYIISSGITTQTPPDKIRERLRDIYG